MIGQVSRWGNSLAVRIPRAMAQSLSIVEGRSVDLRVEDGRLVIVPRDEQPAFTLEALLAGVTDDNIHDEIEAGTPVGREAW